MTTEKMASRLGYAGLIPFLVFAVFSAWTEPDNAGYLKALIAYGATILAFLGGVHWGHVLRNDSTDRVAARLLIAVIPQLIAWIALLLAPLAGILLLGVALVLMLAVDLDAVRRGIFPAWYRPLRWVLTTVATLSLVLSLG